MTVSITSGEFKGRKIETPEEGTHPMGAREKLALFNMVGDIVAGARVLDAYAGSGALGFEALSRGAEKVDFVEKAHRAHKIIRKNAQALGVMERCNFYNMSVEAFALSLVPNGRLLPGTDLTALQRYDLIVADPPYDKYDPTVIDDLWFFLRDNNGILVLSHPTDEAPQFLWGELLTTRNYAGAHISVYRKRDLGAQYA